MLDFPKRVLFLGYGAVAQCALPIFVKHVRIPPANISVMDFEDRSRDSQALDRPGRALGPAADHSGKSRGGTGKARLGRRPDYRPGLEHRLLRNPPVLPRPRRFIREHLGRGLGSVRRRRSQASHHAHAVLAAHERSADDRRMVRTRPHGGARTRRQSGPDLPLDQARALSTSAAACWTIKKSPAARPRKSANLSPTARSTAWR